MGTRTDSDTGRDNPECIQGVTQFQLLMRVRNSSRVFGSSRNTPSMVLVTVLLFIFCTPRITMHMCLGESRGDSGHSWGRESHRGRWFLHGHIQFWGGHKTSTSRNGTCSTSAVEGSHPQPLSSAFSPLIPGKSHLPKVPSGHRTCLLLVPGSALLQEGEGAQAMDLVQWGQLLPATSPQRIRQLPL